MKIDDFLEFVSSHLIDRGPDGAYVGLKEPSSNTLFKLRELAGEVMDEMMTPLAGRLWGRWWPDEDDSEVVTNKPVKPLPLGGGYKGAFYFS